MWDRATEEKKQARKVTHEEDIEWVETPQDYKVGLLIAPELGFRTWGTESLIADVTPASTNTAKNRFTSCAVPDSASSTELDTTGPEAARSSFHLAPNTSTLT